MRRMVVFLFLFVFIILCAWIIFNKFGNSARHRAKLSLTGKINWEIDHAGETVVFAISPVGTSEYVDQGVTELEGKKVRLITFTTKVPGFNDLEKIYVEPQTFLPLKVERFISIFLVKEYIVEDYVPAEGTLVITKFVKNKKVKEYDYKADGPIHNAVILPFYLRRVPDLAIGWSFIARFPEEIKVTLTSTEEIKVPAGIFQAYHFTSNPDKFEIWISKDKDRLPLKIKSTNGYGYTMVMQKHSLDKGAQGEAG